MNDEKCLKDDWDNAHNIKEMEHEAQASFMRAKIRLLTRYNYLILLENKTTAQFDEFKLIADLILQWYALQSNRKKPYDPYSQI